MLYSKVIRPLLAKSRDARKNANPKTDSISCVHQPDGSDSPCAQCAAERSTATRYRVKIILGLMLAFWLQALDLTIISPILIDIADIFHAVSEFSWVISAFTLVSAAFIPFWGQMADVFGRHATLQTTLLLVAAGSAICTGAPASAFGLLLFGRALQGLGCSGISVLIRIIISDRVSLKENAVTWSWFSVAGGIAYGVGPQIGSKLANASWRWCFAISIIVAVIAMLLLFFVLRRDLLGPQPITLHEKNPNTNTNTDADADGRPTHMDARATLTARLSTIDIGGQLLFIAGLGLFVLGLTWGGAEYAWTSAAVLVPLISGSLLLVAFGLWERSMDARRFLGRRLPHQKPMIPWAVLSDRNILVVFFSGFVYSMTTYAIIYFCPIYLAVVKGQSAEEAGRAILFFLPGLGVGAWASIFLCNKWPRMTIVPIISGAVIELVGIIMLAVSLNTEKLGVIYAMMSVASAGGALRIMASSLHGIGMFRNNIPSVVSLQLLASPLGGTLGVTVMSVVFNNVSKLGGSTSDISSGFTAALSSATPADQLAILHNVKMGLVYAVVSVVPFSALCVLASLTLGNVTLPRSSESHDDQMQHHVVREPYLLVLLRGPRDFDYEANHIELESTSDAVGRPSNN